MYCTAAQFKERFGTDEHDNLLATDTGRTYGAAAADADAYIDAFIGARYAVPLATVPSLILSIAADFTRYELYEEAPPKEVIERRKQAIEVLEQIRDGKLALPGASMNASGVTVAVSAADPVFTEETLSQYVGVL